MPLLENADREKLLEAYTERKVYTKKVDRFSFSKKQFDDFFRYANLRDGDIRIAKDGKPVSADNFISTINQGRTVKHVVDKPNVVELFQKGCTVIFEKINNYNSFFNELSSDLSSIFEIETWINCYLTPQNARGFELHTDGHDVFVIQLTGGKTWDVVEDGNTNTYNLEQGSVLYLPKGTPHKAETNDEYSFHATVGFYPNTYFEVLRPTILKALKKYDDRIFSKDDEILNQIIDDIKQQLTDVELKVKRERKEELGIFESVDAVNSINEFSEVGLKSSVQITLANGKLLLIKGKMKVVLDESLFTVIKEIKQRGKYSVATSNNNVHDTEQIKLLKLLYKKNMLILYT